MDIFMTSLGIVGAILGVVSYLLLERDMVSSQGMNYYLMNGVGAFFVLVAVLYSFDSGDIGAISQEIAWVAISAMGIAKVFFKKKVQINND